MHLQQCKYVNTMEEAYLDGILLIPYGTAIVPRAPACPQVLDSHLKLKLIAGFHMLCMHN